MMELKPCPFCGNTPVLVRWGNKWCVECHSDDCEIRPETAIALKEEAVEAWNRRVNDDTERKAD